MWAIFRKTKRIGWSTREPERAGSYFHSRPKERIAERRRLPEGAVVSRGDTANAQLSGREHTKG